MLYSCMMPVKEVERSIPSQEKVLAHELVCLISCKVCCVRYYQVLAIKYGINCPLDLIVNLRITL